MVVEVVYDRGWMELVVMICDFFGAIDASYAHFGLPHDNHCAENDLIISLKCAWKCLSKCAGKLFKIFFENVLGNVSENLFQNVFEKVFENVFF